MDRIINTYKSRFGKIELSISSKRYEFSSIQQKIGKVDLFTLNYDDGSIKIREFKIHNPDEFGSKIQSSVGWSIIIDSIKDNNAVLIFKCQFKERIKGEISTGEHLDALQFFKNTTYDLHIGTEDPESIMWRADAKNYMPKRFFKLLKHKDQDYADKSFTDYLENGFRVTFPKLLNGEVVKFHFLIAESELSDEYDVSSWLIVEKRIEEVEKIIENDMMT